MVLGAAEDAALLQRALHPQQRNRIRSQQPGGRQSKAAPGAGVKEQISSAGPVDPPGPVPTSLHSLWTALVTNIPRS